MKRAIFCLSILLNLILVFVFFYNCYIEEDRKSFFSFRTYAEENSGYFQIADTCTGLFIGNSITANWMNVNPEFFWYNDFINRGIGGETSSQISLRFQADVISLKPSLVIISTGINDIGEGDGFYNQSFTLQNIQSMIDICKAHNIIPILASVLPATEIRKNRFEIIQNLQFKIEVLNKEIINLANINNLKYVDYNSIMQNSDGTFNELYTFDGIHPNEEGYKLMEKLILETIIQVIDK